MFGFLNKKLELSALANGKLIAIEDVADNVFSSKTMGDGFAVQPTSGDIYAPVTGTITTVFPTKHAFGIKTPQGFEVLVHLGVDTVELEGKPFEVFVSVNDQVNPATKIASMDLEAIKEAGKETDAIVVFTNAENPTLTINGIGEDVKAQQTIGELKAKIKK